ncbi:MAG: ATP-binding protein [Candidatus Margulisiibacteriota bacterium]
MYDRQLAQSIENDLEKNQKVVVVYGPRQVGKTTLIKAILKRFPKQFLSINADETKYHGVLSSCDLVQLNGLIDGYDGIFIDEAQRVPNIGLTLKLLHDELPDFRVIATGSSSFDLANRVQEPLTGRSWTYTLHPLSVLELRKQFTPFELRNQLTHLLVYGSYPDVLNQTAWVAKERTLRNLAEAYLYKDILEMLSLKKSNQLELLLRLLAHQIGSEVSLSELGRQLGLSKETVGHYIDLLEKSFVIFRLPGFSRNLRNELSKMDKIYFVDVGIRNAVLRDFTPLDQRLDIGPLWENFMLSERRKTLGYLDSSAQMYFWRTYAKSEIDYIETHNQAISAVEFKWKNKEAKPPKAWVEGYPTAPFQTVHPDNFVSFLCGR